MGGVIDPYRTAAPEPKSPRKSWWKRNQDWALPVTVCGTFAAILISTAYLVITDGERAEAQRETERAHWRKTRCADECEKWLKDCAKHTGLGACTERASGLWP